MMSSSFFEKLEIWRIVTTAGVSKAVKLISCKKKICKNNFFIIILNLNKYLTISES